MTIRDRKDPTSKTLRVIGPDEIDRVTRGFNETSHAGDDRLVTEMFWEHARTRRDDIAVVGDGERLTFGELAGRAARLARELQRRGAGPDDCVGLFVEPSAELMVGAWGILLSGCAYLPLSTEYPEERLRYMIEQSGTKVIVCAGPLAGRVAQLAPRGIQLVTLEAATDAADVSVAAPWDAGLRPHHLAYVIYTSGSTGRPKGVMIEHRSIANQMRWLRAVYGIDRKKTIVQKTPISFDAAQWEILAPSCGSTVVAGRLGIHRDPDALIEMIARHEVTTLQCVPTLLQALLDSEELQRCTSLQQIFCGGEALARSLAARCQETLPWCTVVNLYGPTECTINSSAFTVDRASLERGPQTISIGAPVHNTRYYVLDGERAPVAIGDVGELYISGAQLARGYLNRPDLTAERFVANPLGGADGHERLYKTGDLASWSPDGTVQFVGRTDSQVKLRGFRVELDEIKLAIETHDWVKHAAVVVKSDGRTGFQNLLAFIELNPKEAALMDQGNHDAHHQSKASKLQVKAQLSTPGCREPRELAGRETIELPGRMATPEQRRAVFARKTYRFFEGGPVTRDDILRLLATRRAPVDVCARPVEALSLAELGALMRWFGQFISEERLLPKYGYASPGALYATQQYVELHGIAGLKSGYYYHHPVHHQLVLIEELAPAAAPRFHVHFIGKRSAIEPVYKNNLREVLEIETGHMLGLWDTILPRYGLGIAPAAPAPETKRHLGCADEDEYLGTFAIGPQVARDADDAVELYVQSHAGKVRDLSAGQYHYADGALARVSDDLVLKKHVIAINQQVYERASFGITAIARRQDWMAYIALGRLLHHLQANDLKLGLMSSGYSSKSGNDLPSARRIDAVLEASGRKSGASYFFLGGRLSDEQVAHEGMNEDAVHMKGPAEMVKDDLARLLPDYMVPNRVVVLDRLPLTANGKIDQKALESVPVDLAERPFVAPSTRTEQRVSEIWKREMKCDVVSVRDDFFESGGNSLIAVRLISKVNDELGCALPLQVMFESPTIERLAQRIDGENLKPCSRLVRLQARGPGEPIHCWPGLGGYAMNLRLLASRMGGDRRFYGVQAYGINDGEAPHSAIGEMAAADLALIRSVQPKGPYSLWGYSFGARVAFEAAYQLEQAGERVSNLVLIAPGSPRLRAQAATPVRQASFGNEAYVTILLSVFASAIDGAALDECLRVATDEESFASFISARYKRLDAELVKRIARVVQRTYGFDYTLDELAQRRLRAPITIFKARGDDVSFIELRGGDAVVVQLDADHYGVLKEPGVDELVRRIRAAALVGGGGGAVGTAAAAGVRRL